MGRPKDQGLHLKFASARSIAWALGLKAIDRPSKVLREVRDTIAIYRHIAEFDRGSPTATKIRDRILKDCILKLGHNTAALRTELKDKDLQPFLALLPGTRSRGRAYVPSASLKKGLAELAAIASSAREVKLSPGRPKDRALDFLIRDLRDIYRHYAGKRPSLTWLEIRGAFAGDFFWIGRNLP